MWIFLVAIYGLFKGVRDVTKKKALEINSTIEVLFCYTFLSFIMGAVLSFTTGDATPFEMDFSKLFIVAFKSLIIFIAWICSFKAIHKLPIGLFGIMDMSRVIIASVLSIVFLNETPTLFKIIGLLLVLTGLLLVNKKKNGDKQSEVNIFSVMLVLVSCFMNAVSEILDKFLMGSTDMNSGQLQFWYMFFLVVFYLGYMLIKRVPLNVKKIFKNYWILIMSVLFVFGDKALFEACKYENSSVITMTVIKQCSVLVTIIGGKIMFGEKNIMYKIMCAAIIISGIVISLI